MKKVFLGFCVALAAAGCATDGSEGPRSGGGTAGLSESPSSSSDDDFGNSDAVQPPPPVLKPMVSGGGCKAGHYVGRLGGLYMSPAAFEFPVPIETVDLPDLAGGPDVPGFEFWLESDEEMVECESIPGEEFMFCPDFKVEGGIAQGWANGVFPFRMEINGELDCELGRFMGLLENGTYSVFGTDYFYEGTIDASYDAANTAFFDGTWAVSEPMGINAGGAGDWGAGLVP